MKKSNFSGIIIFVIVILMIGILFESSPSISIFIPFIIFSFVIKYLIGAQRKSASDKTKEYNKEDLSNVFFNETINKDKTKKSNVSSRMSEEDIQRPKFSKRCKKCNALISSDDRYCPECGTPQNNTIICEYCGHENPASNALCEKCNGFL